MENIEERLALEEGDREDRWGATALLLTRSAILGFVLGTAAWYLGNWLF